MEVVCASFHFRNWLKDMSEILCVYYKLSGIFKFYSDCSVRNPASHKQHELNLQILMTYIFSVVHVFVWCIFMKFYNLKWEFHYVKFSSTCVSFVLFVMVFTFSRINDFFSDLGDTISWVEYQLCFHYQNKQKEVEECFQSSL
jgi:hypothetical protein